jgi:hypothetical protein
MNILRPYKSDIRQIETLVKLGVNHNDIASILGVTPAKLSKWKDQNQVINELLTVKARPEYTCLHPDFAPMVEEAFTCAGKRFYRFKKEFQMATGRYKYYHAALREMDMHASLETLSKYVDAFEAILNGGKKNKIEFTELAKLVINLKSRIKLAFDPHTVRELAAVAYFDETEDITTFDKAYGEEKIKLWIDNNVLDFFLTRPIGELFTLSNISIESLAQHLTTLEQIVTDLNLDLQTVLEDNS